MHALRRLLLLLLLLQHGIQFRSLLIIHDGPGLSDGGFTQSMDLLDLLVARKSIVIHHGHGLLVLVGQYGTQLCLLVRAQVELCGKHFHLIINGGPACLLCGFSLLVLAGLSRLARLRAALRLLIFTRGRSGAGS
jgi:hypothetical protein